MDTRAEELIRQGDQLFSKRGSLLSFWQEVSDQFYVERANFTTDRSLGEDFAAHLSTSYPLLVRRDLGNSFSAMLRPSDREWFKVGTSRPEREDKAGKQWMEYAGGVMRRALRDRRAMFVRATKEGDHDFATFGQCAISAELNRAKNALLFRCWHLRDVAWMEDSEGKPSTVHRRWKPTARDLVGQFPGKVHPAVMRLMEQGQDPYTEINCRHIVIPAENYAGAKKFREPVVSIYIDIDNRHVMEEIGIRGPFYIIPRWHTCGTQYAVSPAVVAALPEARLIQAMTKTLNDAGEYAVRPPMLGRAEVVREDVPLIPGGITWIDADYDEKMGEALRPLYDGGANSIPLGRDLLMDSRSLITEAFYLNKLGLPPAEVRDMTAFETSQRVQEYIRNALPLFEPMESEYNGALCDAAFDLLLNGGAFGPMDQIPESLSGADVEWTFESPLRAAIERQKAQRFLETRELLMAAAEIEPSATVHVDIHAAFRDALEGAGVPAKWLTEEKAAAQEIAKAKQLQQTQQALAATASVGTAAEQVGKGGKAVSEAMAMEGMGMEEAA